MATCAQIRKRSGMHKLVRVPFALYGSSIPSLIGVGTTAGREVSDRILKSLPETPLQDRRLGTQTQERATLPTEAPGAKASPTIDRFCPRLHRRRRSGPDSTSTRLIAPSLAPVQATVPAPCQLRPDKPRLARRPLSEGYPKSEEIGQADPRTRANLRRMRRRRRWLRTS